ncbi:allantoate permease [Tirmania nivea]|nr:allantoate permease [Tirmania nivea]
MIDKRVLSIMIFTYFIHALDKGTMGFASIMGIREDANLQGQQDSWLTTCIYIAAFRYPTNYIIQRVPIAKYLSANIMIWGAILAVPQFCWSCHGEEQAQTVTNWYMMNGRQQIVGGVLAYAFTNIPATSPVKSWQALFIAYGIASVLGAKCWSEEDKKLMVEHVRSNQTGMQNKQFRKEKVFEALKDPQTWCYALIQIFTTLPTSGLGAFSNIIIKSFNFTTLQTQLWAMVLGAYLIAILLSSAWIAKKTNKTVLIMAAYRINSRVRMLSIVGTIALMAVISKPTDPLGKRVSLLISYYVCLSLWATTMLCLSLVSRNVAGQTKKSVMITTNFVAWAVGNSIGPQVFLAWDAPRYFIAFSVHMVCYGLLLIVLAFLRRQYVSQNNRKSKVLAEGRAVKDEGLTRSFE